MRLHPSPHLSLFFVFPSSFSSSFSSLSLSLSLSHFDLLTVVVGAVRFSNSDFTKQHLVQGTCFGRRPAKPNTVAGCAASSSKNGKPTASSFNVVTKTGPAAHKTGTKHTPCEATTDLYLYVYI